MSDSTEIEMSVRIVACASCVQCGRLLKLENVVSGEQIESVRFKGGIGTLLSETYFAIKERFAMDLNVRGWTPEHCGQCRDPGGS